MKKYVAVAIALTIVTSACQKIEELEGHLNVPENILTASINAETRTMLGESDGTQYPFWSEGDEIGVFIDGSSKTTYKLKDGAGTPKATFTGLGSGSKYVAVYPAVAAGSIDGNIISLDLPSEQIWAESSFGPNSFSMVAVSNTENLNFKNLCSVFKIQLTGNATILSVSFKPNDETIRVAGGALADISKPDVPALTMTEEALNEVTLKCPEGGVALAGKDPVDFYMVLPAQTYTGGFALTIRSTGGTMIQSTTKDLVMQRSKIRAAAPFEFKVNVGITPSETLSGEGTDSVPFLVRDVSDLLLFRNAVNNAGKIRSTDTGEEAPAQTSYYQLNSDVDLSGIGENWIPIGTSSTNPFKGTFNGAGRSITGLHIESTFDYVGLFGYCSGASIKNLSVTGEVSGQSYVSLISGYAVNGTISNCQTFGSLKGIGNYIGGIAGYIGIDQNIISKYERISDCSNHAGITGYYRAGGIVGYAYYSYVENCQNFGRISNIAVDGYVHRGMGGIAGSFFYSRIYNCSNQGDVSGWSDVGGIAGSGTNSSNPPSSMPNNYFIVNCYNTGIISGSGSGIGGIVGSNPMGLVANSISVGKVSGSNSAVGGIVGENSGTGTIRNCYWLSTCGADEGVGANTGTSTSVFALSEYQISREESTGFALYTDAEGKYYTILRDALNAWAADNSGTVVYYGWDYSGNDICPTFTFRPAVKPGSGSDENFSHSFGVVHTRITFVLPGITGSFMNATVDWGDETKEVYGFTSSHSYSSTGEHTVTVTADNATSFKLGNLSGVTELMLD